MAVVSVLSRFRSGNRPQSNRCGKLTPILPKDTDRGMRRAKHLDLNGHAMRFQRLHSAKSVAPNEADSESAAPRGLGAICASEPILEDEIPESKSIGDQFARETP